MDSCTERGCKNYELRFNQSSDRDPLALLIWGHLGGDPVTTEGFKAKLTKIFSADVAGYRRLMGEDEAAKVKTLTVYRGIMAELIKQHGGRVVDSPGQKQPA